MPVKNQVGTHPENGRLVSYYYKMMTGMYAFTLVY